MTRLSPHFRLAEFDCHDGTPAPWFSVRQLEHLCTAHLEPLRKRYGPCTVVSGYRTRRYNIAVGGAPASFHVYSSRRYGVAADVVFATGSGADWARSAALTDPGGLGAYHGHLHVDTRRGHARW